MPVRGRDRRVSTLLSGVTVSPKQVAVGKSERVVVTFSQEDRVPEASLFLVFTSSSTGLPQIVRTEKVDEHSIAAIAPVNSSEESVKLEVLYIEQDTTFVLFRDRISYVGGSDGMGASLTSNKGSLELRDSPLRSPLPPTTSPTALQQLKVHLVKDRVEPLSPSSLKELCSSLKALPSCELAQVDEEVGGDMERGAVPVSLDVEGKSQDNNPQPETTLIHVLAEFGLQKIVQQILKLPEATQVVIRLNVQGLLPEEIAEKHGHKELSRMLGKCRSRLPCRERDSRSHSTSSLDGEWSTITVRTRKKSDRNLVRVASYSKGQLVKLAMEEKEFSSFKTELGSGSESELIDSKEDLNSVSEDKDEFLSAEEKSLNLVNETPPEDSPSGLNGQVNCPVNSIESSINSIDATINSVDASINSIPVAMEPVSSLLEADQPTSEPVVPLEEKAVVPSEERDVVPSEEEKAVVPSEEEKGVVPSEEEKGVVPSEEEKGVVPSEEEKGVVPSEEEKGVVPSEEEKGVVLSEEEEAVVPSEEEKGIVLSEEEKGVASEFVEGVLSRACARMINEEIPVIPVTDTRDPTSCDAADEDIPALATQISVDLQSLKESSDELCMVDSLTEVTCSAPDLMSDGDPSITPTPTPTDESEHHGSHHRAHSIANPELVPLRILASHPRLSSTRDSWRRSKSLNAVDIEEEPIWEETVESDGHIDVSSDSSLSSDDEGSESPRGEESPQQESDTDSFLSAREDFPNSPSLPRSLKKEGSAISNMNLLKVSEVVKKAASKPLSIPSTAGDEVGRDTGCVVNGGGECLVPAVPTVSSTLHDATSAKEHKMEKSVVLEVPKGVPRAESTESNMGQMSDLNLSDVDVEVLDGSMGRDRGKSDPLPFSIVVATQGQGEMESSRSHEMLLSTPTCDTPPDTTTSQPQETPSFSSGGRQTGKKKGSRSKTHLGLVGQAGCDSGFESSNSRNASSVSDTMPAVMNTLASVNRSQSTRSDSDVAEKVRSSFTLQAGTPPLHRHSTEELRDNNTLPPSPLVVISPKGGTTPPTSRSPIHSQDHAPMGGSIEVGDELEEPQMYQTSVEEVVLRRKVSSAGSSPMRKTVSDSHMPSPVEEKQAKVLVSPSRSKSRRTSGGGDSPTTPPHNLMNSISSNSVLRKSSNSEGQDLLESTDGWRRGSIRSMYIQPSASMNFAVDNATLVPTITESLQPLPTVQVSSPVKYRANKPKQDGVVRASIAGEFPSQVSTSPSLCSQTSSQSVSYWNEDQASVTELTIEEEHESGSSNGEQDEDEDKRPLSKHPELAVPQQVVWSQTVSKKLLKTMSRAARDRQALMFEFVQTERNHHQSLALMALVFRDGMVDKALLSREQIDRMFPELDQLLSISERFSKSLARRKDECQDGILDSITDILLQQFVGWRADQMVKAFGTYAANQKYIVTSYKEQMKVKKFRRFVNECCKNPAANRRNFPDIVQSITARISKYVILMENLVKESERCTAQDLEDLYASRAAIQRVVQNVEDVVKEKTSRMELVRIQDKLEVHIPKSVVKDEKRRKDLKSILFTAKHRRLLKDGQAIWLGSHQRALDVYVVLVTDFIAFLTDTNGKYNIALLQDFQPPVIRLVDIHARIDAASKVQLLILKKERPEIYKLKFKNSIACDQWQKAISSAIDVCRDNKYTCATFGGNLGSQEEEIEEPSMEPKDQVISSAHKQVATAQKLLERSVKPAVFRSGSFAAADRPVKSLLQRDNPRMTSQRGLGGSRSRPERKSVVQKTKDSVPQEYISAMSDMTDTVQKLLECITEQDITIARLRDQLQRLTGLSDLDRTLKRQPSSASVTSESNLDWGTRPPAATMTTVDEKEDNNPPVATRVRLNTVSQSKYNRPRSFHEELTRSYDS